MGHLELPGHTHGNKAGAGEIFSPQDRGFHNLRHWIGYLGTPAGAILKLTPKDRPSNEHPALAAFGGKATTLRAARQRWTSPEAGVCLQVDIRRAVSADRDRLGAAREFLETVLVSAASARNIRHYFVEPENFEHSPLEAVKISPLALLRGTAEPVFFWWALS